MGGNLVSKIENNGETTKEVLFSEMPANIARLLKKETTKSSNRFKERLRYFLRKIRLR